MPNKNKDRGKKLEQRVCDIFTAVTGKKWMRVPNSGAYIGGKNVFRKKSMDATQILLTRGDVIPPDEYKNVIIECKKRKEFAWHQLFSSSKDLESFLEQVILDSAKGDIVLVIFGVDYKGEYVVHDIVQDSNVTAGMDYYSIKQDKWYRIEQLSEEWIEKNIKKA
jgi:hypothetical protein